MPPFAPFANFEENDACAGTNEILLNLLFNDGLTEFELVNLPYARILHSLKTGTLDIGFIFKNSSLKGEVDFIGPVSKSKVIVIVQPEITIKHYNDLASIGNIAVIRNANFEQKFDQDTQLKKVAVESYRQGLSMFKYKRVNAIVGSVTGLEYAIYQQNMPADLLSNALDLGEKEWWLNVSHKSKNQYVKKQLVTKISDIFQEDLIHQLYLTQMKECVDYQIIK